MVSSPNFFSVDKKVREKRGGKEKENRTGHINVRWGGVLTHQQSTDPWSGTAEGGRAAPLSQPPQTVSWVGHLPASTLSGLRATTNQQTLNTNMEGVCGDYRVMIAGIEKKIVRIKMTPLITFITFPFYMLETCIRVYEIEPDGKIRWQNLMIYTLFEAISIKYKCISKFLHKNRILTDHPFCTYNFNLLHIVNSCCYLKKKKYVTVVM